MTLNTGNWILLEGKKVQIIARWASGAHTKFVLSDGRELLDLHKRTDVKAVAEDRKVVLGGGDGLIGDSIWKRRKSTPEIVNVEEVRDRIPNGEDLLD